MRDIVYCTGVSLMDEDVWEFIWMKFHSTTAVSEKKILLEALTCSDDRNLLNRYKNILYLYLLPIITSTFMIHHLSFDLNERTLLLKHRLTICLNCLMFALMHMKIDTHYVFSLPNFPIFIGNVWNPIIIGVIFLLAYPLFKCIDQSGLTDFIKMCI